MQWICNSSKSVFDVLIIQEYSVKANFKKHHCVFEHPTSKVSFSIAAM